MDGQAELRAALDGKADSERREEDLLLQVEDLTEQRMQLDSKLDR